jgi:tRNA pseudouridine32 synthase / 23S rRNA pseudouridine746 synthase
MSSIPDVALVWERSVTTRNTIPVPCIKVSLQPIEGEETVVELSESNSPPNVESETEDSTSIPDSVLLYERQMRKAQHAKKTGQLLPEELQVIYVDEWIVVVNKPAGVLTVPGINNHPSLLDRVHALYGEQMTDPANMIVHRLDMDTSGLVIFARSVEVSKQMHAIFRDREVVKEYECLVVGHLRLPKWTKDDQDNEDDSSSRTINSILIDLPLQRDHEHPPFMRVSTPQSEAAAMACVDQLQKHGWKKILRKSAKPSQSLVTIVEVGTQESVTIKKVLPFTRLRLEPITGRTHQLRVHW